MVTREQQAAGVVAKAHAAVGVARRPHHAEVESRTIQPVAVVDQAIRGDREADRGGRRQAEQPVASVGGHAPLVKPGIQRFGREPDQKLRIDGLLLGAVEDEGGAGCLAHSRRHPEVIRMQVRREHRAHIRESGTDGLERLDEQQPVAVEVPARVDHVDPAVRVTQQVQERVREVSPRHRQAERPYVVPNSLERRGHAAQRCVELGGARRLHAIETTGKSPRRRSAILRYSRGIRRWRGRREIRPAIRRDREGRQESPDGYSRPDLARHGSRLAHGAQQPQGRAPGARRSLGAIVVKRLVTGAPATVGYLVILVVAAAVTGPLNGPSATVLRATSTGYYEVTAYGRWWTPLTSVFFTHNLVELIAVVVIGALCIGLAEHRLGTRRTVIIGLVSVSIATLLGIGVQALGILQGELWSRDVHEFQVVDPFALIVAVLLASTAYMGSIWRSRIRVITITVCLMFLLYSGQPSDLYRMLAALIGLGIGAAFHPRTARTRWIRSSHHDIRVLATSLVVITAVGPVITLLSGRRFGALAPLGLLMSGATPSDNRVRLDCDALHVTRQCLHDLALQRVDSPGPVILTLLPLVMLLVAALGLGHGRRLAAWLTIGVNVGLAALGAYYYGFMPFVDARDAAIPQDPHYWEITLALSSSIVVPLFIAGFVARNLRHFTVRAVPRQGGGLCDRGRGRPGRPLGHLPRRRAAHAQPVQPTGDAGRPRLRPARALRADLVPSRRTCAVRSHDAPELGALRLDRTDLLADRHRRRTHDLRRPRRPQLCAGGAAGPRDAEAGRRRIPQPVGDLEGQLLLVQRR
ncbi:MAG: hypothetical protein WDM88_03045 [Galbitalea sp.]